MNWKDFPVVVDGGLLRIGHHNVMHEAERPIMETFAYHACESRGDILEMGFGLGVCADVVRQFGVRSHTIIEGHPKIASMARQWASGKNSTFIIEGDWQEVMPGLSRTFDGVIYDSYEMTESDRIEDFIRQSSRILRPGGVFSGWLNDDPPTPSIMAALLDSFDEVRFLILRNLPNCITVQRSRMVIPVARKRN